MPPSEYFSNKMARQTDVFIALKYPVKMLFFAAAALSQVLLVSADKHHSFLT